MANVVPSLLIEEDKRLGARLERLLSTLRAEDGFDIGPEAQALATAVAATLTISTAVHSSRDALLLLRGALQSVLAKSGSEAATFRNRFDKIFEVPTIAAADEEVSKQKQTTHKPWLSDRQVVIVGVFVALALSAAQWWGPDIVRRWWQPTNPIVADQNRIQSTQPQPRPEATKLPEPQKPPQSGLRPEEIQAVAARIVREARLLKDQNLWQITARLSIPYLPPDMLMQRFKLLMRYSGLSSDGVLNVQDRETLARLTTALLHLDRAGHSLTVAEAEEGLRNWAPPADDVLANVRSPYERPQIAAYEPSETWHMPIWLTVFVVGLALTPLIRWLAGQIRRKRGYLRRELANQKPRQITTIEAGSDVAHEVGTMRASLREAARQMLARQPETSREIDVERTVIASASGRGRFAPVFAERRSTPDYLILISSDGPYDDEAARLSWLVERLIAEDVSITRYFLERDGRRVYAKPHTPRIPLADLYARHRQARLLLIGTGDSWLNPQTYNPHPWAEVVTLWETRALVTPVPRPEWRAREDAASALFNGEVHEATSDGLRRLGERLRRMDASPNATTFTGRTLQVPSWRDDQFRWQLRMPADPDRSWTGMRAELDRYLDSSAMTWLRALAVYPALRWDLMLYLGMQLRDGGQTVFSEARAVRLCRIPWFRQGYMPDWVRVRLLAEIEPERRQEITNLIGTLLNGGVTGGDGTAQVRLPIAIEAGASSNVVRQSHTHRAADDAVLLDFLENQNEAAFVAPQSLTERLLGARHTFRIQERATGIVGAIYALAFLWFLPKPWDGPLLTGAFLPLIALALGALLWPVARRLAFRGEATVGGGA